MGGKRKKRPWKKQKGAHYRLRGNRKKQKSLVVAHVQSHSDAVLHSTASRVYLDCYSPEDRIALFGEGNYTFAAALATKFGGKNITATSLDTEAQTIDKYSDVALIAIHKLRSSGAKLLFGLDVLKKACLHALESSYYDYAVFNFPHVGGATDADIEANKVLIKQFCSNVKAIVRKKGEIHLRLRSSAFYEKWGVTNLAHEAGLRLLRQEPFQPEEYVQLGYKEARTNPATRDPPPITGNSKLYCFRIGS